MRVSKLNASVVSIGDNSRITVPAALTSHFDVSKKVAVIPENKSTLKLTQKFTTKKAKEAKKVSFFAVSDTANELQLSVGRRFNSFNGNCVIYKDKDNVIVKYIS